MHCVFGDSYFSVRTHLLRKLRMSFIEQSLSQGEEIKGLFSFHWFAWVPMTIWLILGLVTFGITWLIAIYEYLRHCK